MIKLRKVFTDDLIMVIPLVGFFYAMGVFYVHPVFNDFKHKEGFLDDPSKPIYWISILVQGYSLSGLTQTIMLWILELLVI